jgi:hypothetical protein
MDSVGPGMSRSAIAAFLGRQLVLVGLVLASREIGWPRS